MASIPSKRTRTLVDSEVQGGLVRRVAFHWIVFFICNTLALVVWIRLFEQPDAAWSESFADTIRRFLPFFIITAALIPAFVWDTLKLSNRFAGPIRRLRDTLIDMKQGRSVPPLKFRENDFWQEIASNFNEVVGLGKSSADETGQEPTKEA